jgi:hypothetical protein
MEPTNRRSERYDNRRNALRVSIRPKQRTAVSRKPVTVTSGVEHRMAQYELRLSRCPGATALPMGKTRPTQKPQSDWAIDQAIRDTLNRQCLLRVVVGALRFAAVSVPVQERRVHPGARRARTHPMRPAGLSPADIEPRD